MFEDEASFQLDPTLHRTWARRGQQPRVPTRGERKTAHVYGAITTRTACFSYAFADVFNGASFLSFLKLLVRRFRRHKVFLIIDNAPCHSLTAEGQVWLATHHDRIELHRLPSYSPELNPTEGVWKTTRKMTTHNRFFATTVDRDKALVQTFHTFQREPWIVAAYVDRFS
jgi:transposase